MRISGQTAIVTGGASGLGRACVEKLRSDGARVFIADIDDDSGRRVASETGASFLRTDVTSESDVEQILEAAWKASGPVRILVNCAGIAPDLLLSRREGPHSIEAFRRTLGTNVTGTFLPLTRFAQRLRGVDPIDGDAGVVIMTSSIAAFDGQPGHVAYSASKGAIAAMTLPAARDLARFFIRVMTVAPGTFETPMMAGIPNPGDNPLGSQTPHPARLGQPEEFASLVAHIIENLMLNGEVIRIDGALRLGPR